MLKSVLAWALMPFGGLVLMASSANATVSTTLTTIPTYQYFYTCASGVENCVNFQKSQNYFGDFGMTGLIPTNWVCCGPVGGFYPLLSNAQGQVLGNFSTSTGNALSYGFNGQVTCIGGICNDDNWAPTGLNNNGLYVFNGPGSGGLAGGGAGIGLGSNFTGLRPNLLNFTDPIFMIRADGINDQNQILALIDTPTGSIQGILTTTPIPEPSTWALLGTILCLCLILRARSRSMGGNQDRGYPREL